MGPGVSGLHALLGVWGEVRQAPEILRLPQPSVQHGRLMRLAAALIILASVACLYATGHWIIATALFLAYAWVTR